MIIKLNMVIKEGQIIIITNKEAGEEHIEMILVASIFHLEMEGEANRQISKNIRENLIKNIEDLMITKNKILEEGEEENNNNRSLKDF